MGKPPLYPTLVAAQNCSGNDTNMTAFLFVRELLQGPGATKRTIFSVQVNGGMMSGVPYYLSRRAVGLFGNVIERHLSKHSHLTRERSQKLSF